MRILFVALFWSPATLGWTALPTKSSKISSKKYPPPLSAREVVITPALVTTGIAENRGKPKPGVKFYVKKFLIQVVTFPLFLFRILMTGFTESMETKLMHHPKDGACNKDRYFIEQPEINSTKAKASLEKVWAVNRQESLGYPKDQPLAWIEEDLRNGHAVMTKVTKEEKMGSMAESNKDEANCVMKALLLDSKRALIEAGAPKRLKSFDCQTPHWYVDNKYDEEGEVPWNTKRKRAMTPAEGIRWLAAELQDEKQKRP